MIVTLREGPHAGREVELHGVFPMVISVPEVDGERYWRSRYVYTDNGGYVYAGREPGATHDEITTSLLSYVFGNDEA